MDFTLTEEQELLVDTARALLANEVSGDVVRRATTDRAAARSLFDAHLRDWVALADGPMTDLVLFLTEYGAAVAPGPFFVTTACFAPLVRAAGHPIAADALSGEVSGSVAATSPGTTTCTQVIDLDLVDQLAVVLPAAGGGSELVVVDANVVAARTVETLDLARPWSTVDVADLVGSGDAVGLDPAALRDAAERATLAVAAEAVGCTRWLVDAAVAYAGERVQFGKPIGSFQALQHKLVDTSLAHQEAAAAVSYAAMCIDADDADRTRAVHVAKATAGRAARKAAKDALQVHGGIGYTWEHDLHLRLRRAYADDALYGTADHHLDRLAALLFAT